MNRIEMIWTVFHLWLSRAHFKFLSELVIVSPKNGNGMASFLQSKNAMIQGDPITMVAYGIVILLTIKKPKAEFNDVN